jgi:hypothetical protein
VRKILRLMSAPHVDMTAKNFNHSAWSKLRLFSRRTGFPGNGGRVAARLNKSLIGSLLSSFEESPEELEGIKDQKIVPWCLWSVCVSVMKLHSAEFETAKHAIPQGALKSFVSVFRSISVQASPSSELSS